MERDLNKILQDNFAKGSQAVPYDFDEGVWLPKDYLEVKEVIRNLKIRDDDIWVCGYQKTGTTWTREMVWCVANNLNFQGAAEKLYKRFHEPEASYAFRTRCLMRRKNLPLPGLSIREIEQLPSPRFIASHLPYHLLPRELIERKTKAKIIYVSRDPKDTCISSYHFYQYAEGYCGNFENFCQLFMGGRVVFGPFWQHVIGYWNHAESENVLLLKYEDMKKDLASVIQKTASFLNKSLNEQEIRDLVDHLSFKSMKSNSAVNNETEFENLNQHNLWDGRKVTEKFFRKGEANQWKTDMSQDLVQQFDDWANCELKNFHNIKMNFCD